MSSEPSSLSVGPGRPPGTVYLHAQSHEHVVRSPEPSNDPNDPLNWSMPRKVLHVALLFFYTLMMFAANTASIPLYADMSASFNYSEDVLDDSFAGNSAALAVGCIIFVPFALLIGRRVVYLVTVFLMTGCAIWSALCSSGGNVIGSSILMGIAGAVNETLIQVTITDMFFVHQRGTVNGIYLISVMAGEFLAPVAAGYIAEAQGWRWSYWWVTILLGIVCVLFVFALEESKFVPTLPADPGANELRDSSKYLVEPVNETAKSHTEEISVKQHSELASEPNFTLDNNRLIPIENDIPRKTYLQRLSLFASTTDLSVKNILRLMYQPLLILWHFPAIAIVSLIYGFYISTINILAATSATIYPEPPYNFSSIGVGNLNIAPLVGAILGSAFGGPFTDRAIIRFARANKGLYEPEMRLRMFFVPATSMTVGIFFYGLTVAKGMHWIIPAIGSAFMGFGLSGSGDVLLTYLQDSYRDIIGTTLIGATFIANLLGTLVLIVLGPWQDGMGTYNMFVLLGCMSVLFILGMVPVLMYGRKWRIRTAKRYRELASRQIGSTG